MLSVAQKIAVAVPAEIGSAGPNLYLRRAPAARVRARRPVAIPWLIGLVIVTALLFARVWQVTVAHSLSMERDQLRKEVHSLQNRIRLSSELAVQSTLREGLDYEVLAKQGFQSPDPAVLVDIDLAQPFPSVVPRQGAMARLSADVGRLVRGILPAQRAASAADVRVLPVNAETAP